MKQKITPGKLVNECQLMYEFESSMFFSGNCTCEQNFAGSDCSFDLLGPPSITHISDFGFCDKSKETCDEITLDGKYFIEKMNTKCYMTRKTVKTLKYETEVLSAFCNSIQARNRFCVLVHETEQVQHVPNHRKQTRSEVNFERPLYLNIKTFFYS